MESTPIVPATDDAFVGIRALRAEMGGVRFLWALVTPTILLGLSLATYALATRLLAPSEFARFAVAMAVLATLVPFVSLGAPVILVRHVAGAEAPAASSFRTAVYVLVLVESGAVVALALLVDLLPGETVGRWLAPGLAAIVALGAASTAIVELRLAEYQASFRFFNQSAGLIGAALFRLAGMAAAMLFVPDPDHRAAVAGYVAGATVGTLALAHAELRFATQHMRHALRSIRDDLVRVGLPITISSLFAVLAGNLDTLVAAAWLGPEELAHYAAANRLALIHVTAIGGLTTLALPVAATLARRGSLAAYARVSTVLGLLLGIAAVLVSIAAAPIAVELLFGETYKPSVGIFVMLSIGFVLNYAGNPLSQVLYMTNRARTMAIVQGAQVVVFATVAGAAASGWGAMGLAVARTMTNLAAVCVIGVVAIIVSRRMTGVRVTAVSE